MKKGFLGGMFGCFGVGVALIIALIVVVVIANGGKGTTGGSSGTSATPKPVGTKVLLDKTGNGQWASPTFSAPGTWVIDYTYDCASFGQAGNFAIMVEGDTLDVAANQLGMKGADTANVHGGGNVHLSINSECSWHVTAKG